MNKSTNLFGIAGLFLSALFLFNTAKASTITIDYQVTGKDSLYYTDWGHAYNVSGGGNQYDALGRGQAAGHVGYAFRSGQELDLVATSCVRDAGSRCTNANGYNGTFRGLRVYSLVGVWSSSESEIISVGDAFFVGANKHLIAPEANGSLYLFLGDNDGVFADNYMTDHYDISISTNAVPVPAAVWLFGSGLLAITGLARRKHTC